MPHTSVITRTNSVSVSLRPSHSLAGVWCEERRLYTYGLIRIRLWVLRTISLKLLGGKLAPQLVYFVLRKELLKL